MQNKYFALETAAREATVYIFGDIVSWPWVESDVSGYSLAAAVAGLDVDVINVRVNSYGGEVSEGLAIYNSLKNHPAEIRTYCDGFACSAASVVFMAGSERFMNTASLLLIHNVWTSARGNAEALRKEADDLDVVNDATVRAYLEAGISIDEAELRGLMDAETWIAPADAVEMGFASGVLDVGATGNAAASARAAVGYLMSAGLGANNPRPCGTPPSEKGAEIGGRSRLRRAIISAPEGRGTVAPTDGGNPSAPLTGDTSPHRGGTTPGAARHPLQGRGLFSANTPEPPLSGEVPAQGAEGLDGAPAARGSRLLRALMA
jgi:ATP-dependent protease ClpP protease subunit